MKILLEVILSMLYIFSSDFFFFKMVFYIHEGLNVEVFIETVMEIDSEENI